jgi:hypothetical protein
MNAFYVPSKHNRCLVAARNKNEAKNDFWWMKKLNLFDISWSVGAARCISYWSVLTEDIVKAFHPQAK